MRSGQMFTSDLVTSMVIFLTVMNLGFFAIQQSVTGQSQFNTQQRMAQQAYQTGDLLVRTPGYPPGWNRSTVRVVGLASEGQVLNNTKLSELRLIDGYTEQRERLGVLPSEIVINVTRNGSTVAVPGQNGAGGLADDPVAVIVEEGSTDLDDHEFIGALNGSGLTWDLYWPSSNEQAVLDSLTARSVYDHTTDGPEMMDDLFGNLSDAGYRTVLAEDAGVTVDQVSMEAEMAAFVEEGGRLIHGGDDPAFIRELFELVPSGATDTSGMVRKGTPLLNQSLETGEAIEFVSAPMAFDTPDTVFVNGTADPGCLVCRWNIGAGQVFYVADTHTSSGSSVFQDGSAAFTGPLSLVFGNPVPADAANVAVSRRSVIVDSVDGLQRARLRVIVWR